jgi:hypothetical protein
LSRIGDNSPISISQPFWRNIMIEFDYGPVALGGIIAVAFLAPFLYSFFIDKNPKE